MSEEPVLIGAQWCAMCFQYFPLHPKFRHVHCEDCGRVKGCNADCEDMNCEHCYCYREGRDG